MQFALLLCVFQTAIVSGSIVKDFIVNQGFAYSNCVGRTVILVNGYEPNKHPPMYLRVGEEVRFFVSNQLPATAITVHWHGINQLHTPWADGTAHVNDCPLRPGDNHTMTFTAPEEPGTYFWHGHLGLENAMGMQGLIFVVPKATMEFPPAQQHAKDIPLLLTDWYNEPAMDDEANLQMPDEHFVFPGNPDNPLVNGWGTTDCNKAKKNGFRLSGGSLASCQKCVDRSTYSYTIEANQVYMLRIVNGAMLMTMNVIVEGHMMTVVELDGQAVKPTNHKSLDVATGQRIGVLITADQEPRAYWISIKYRLRNSTGHGRAVLRYSTSPDDLDEASLANLQRQHPAWWDTEFSLEQQRSFEATDDDLRDYPEGESVNRQFVFLNSQEYFTQGVSHHIPIVDKSTSGLRLGIGEEQPWGFCERKDATQSFLRWAVARVNWMPPEQPVLQALYHNSDFANQLHEDMGFYKVELGKTYEIVLQNYPACDGTCEAHPWHLHGMHFWHVGTWEGEYNGTVPTEGGGQHYKRDTILVVGQNTSNSMNPFGPASNRTKPCGFTVIRFTVNNRGAWPFHCHIEWHFAIGMFAVFYTDPEFNFPAPPKSYYNDNHVCGHVPVVEETLSYVCGSGWESVTSPECWGATAFMSLLMGCALCLCPRVVTDRWLKMRRERIQRECNDNIGDSQLDQEQQNV